jgi:hypothetical protein
VRLHPLSWLAGRLQLPEGGAGVGSGVVGPPGIVGDGDSPGAGDPPGAGCGFPGPGAGIGTGTTTTGIGAVPPTVEGLDEVVGISSRIVEHALSANTRKATAL